MDRSNTLSRIAALCRANPAACLWAVAYLCLDLATEDLEGLLSGLEAHREATDRVGHLEAYRERWGRVPDTH
jgi:hypothetical protein